MIRWTTEAELRARYAKFIVQEFHVRPAWQQWFDEPWHQVGAALVFVGICMLLAQVFGR